MVVVRASSLAVLAMLAVATTAHASSIADVPAYVVPAVDYTQLFSSSRALLDAMQHDGIVALKNVPGYAALRREYLRKAAECAVHAKDHGAEFLLHRRLQDGTQRYTISTESGRRLDASGFETVENCPGYQQIYHKFSRSIEEAVAKVGRALDASQALQVARRRLQKSGMDSMTAHALMAESLHLDHFHAYEASPTRRLAEKTLEELSLEMHTDNGLMIAMTTPEYFTVAPSGEVASRDTRSEDAGLLIKTAEGKTVRPLLQADELVLMLGEGIQTWIHTTPKLQAVTHGMQYPRGLSYTDKGESHQSLRAWFGKMILLSEDHVMANTGLPYGEFANKTTRYLLDDANDKGFAAIACSPHRRLQSSDDKCTVRTGCTLRPDGNAALVPDGCAITCNHKADDDKKLCADNCQCAAPTNDGSYCWMLCVPLLSTSDCAGEQKCNDAFVKEQLAMTCAAGGGGGGGVVAPATTTAPTTTTAKPVTIVPATVAPTTTTRSPTSQTPAPVSAVSSGSQGSSQTVGKVTAPDLISASSAGSGMSGAEVKTTKPKSSPTPKPSPSKSAASTLTGVAALAVALVASLMI